jgi:branched-chain amino acid aminotransferase, group II
MLSNINITRIANPKQKPTTDKLGFGKIFTDHMLVMDYIEGKGWLEPQIVPYGAIPMDPSTMVYHYGQAVFEGLKAYRTNSGKIQLFRPEQNFNRMNISNDRLCIPHVNVQDCVEAVKALVELEKDWVPQQDGASLYIRPFIISTDPALGVHPAKTYKFIVILSPSGAYYPNGIDPVKIYVENELVRAVLGGTGFAKTPGNYASSLLAQAKAEKLGYVQVLWLDGIEKKYIEEVGSMNVFFKINGEIITPSLDGSILPGITRNSCIHLLKEWGYKVNERKLSIQEVYDAAADGKLEEVFGTGTAAVISPVGELNWAGNIITINDNKIGEVSQKLYDTLTGIQFGNVEDKFGWMVEVK